MAVERILGTETGKSAFEKTDRNVVDLDTRLVADALALATHKAESVSQIIAFDRDSTLTGQQIVSGFNRVPKSITVFTNIGSSKKSSIGFVTKSLQVVGGSRQTDQLWVNSTHGIKLIESLGNEINGKITINDNKTITIDWTKVGSGTTGNMTCFLMAYYHGGE